MQKITRQQFIKICNDMIKKTRNDVTIVNQTSGYKKYSVELDNDFIEKNLRSILDKTKKEDIVSKHRIIKEIGIGHCQEIAEYLAVELATQLQKMETEAVIRILYEEVFDHTYIHVDITLENENSSTWELDAWDPRLIDISKQVNGSIKNIDYLEYGYSATEIHRLDTKYFTKKRKFSFFDLKKPMENVREKLDVTDEDLYDDYTIENALEMGTLCPDTEFHDLQKPSEWQMVSFKVCK